MTETEFTIGILVILLPLVVEAAYVAIRGV